MIVDEFARVVDETPAERGGTGASSNAEARSEATAKSKAKQTQNRGSAVQLLVKSNVQLESHPFLT